MLPGEQQTRINPYNISDTLKAQKADTMAASKKVGQAYRHHF